MRIDLNPVLLLGWGPIETNTLLQQYGVFPHLTSLLAHSDHPILRRFLERFGFRGLTASRTFTIDGEAIFCRNPVSV
jgi:hypothetical protein